VRNGEDENNSISPAEPAGLVTDASTHDRLAKAPMRVVCWSIILLLGTGQLAVGQQPMSASDPVDLFHLGRHPRFEAAAALQGNELGLAATSAFLDSTLIEETAAMLHTIREQIPAVGRVFTASTPVWLEVAVSPDLGVRVGRAAVQTGHFDGSLPLREGVPISGVASFDSLTRLFHVRVVEVWTCDAKAKHCFLFLNFSDYMNVPVVAAAYRRLPGVIAAAPSFENLVYVDIQIAFADSTYGPVSVLFIEGRGDCPSGCLGYVKNLVHYDPRSRQARLVLRDSLERR